MSKLVRLGWVYKIEWLIRPMKKDDLLDYLEDLERQGGFQVAPYFATAAEAHLAAARLRHEGIRCFVSNQLAQSMLPLDPSSIKLYIHSEDWEEALAILQEIDTAVAIEEGLADVDAPLVHRKRGQWCWVLALIMLFLYLLSWLLSH